jgi:hypothetical protein
MVRVGVSQCLNRGWPNHHGTGFYLANLLNCQDKKKFSITVVYIYKEPNFSKFGVQFAFFQYKIYPSKYCNFDKPMQAEFYF